MKRGKHLQVGAGSRSRSQAKAETTARRSRKRAEKRVALEDQSRNGVRVAVRRYEDGTTVDAACACFGHPGRVHSRAECPVRLAALDFRAEAK